jgi:hypothetical protein
MINSGVIRDIHRIGGPGLENLRLKPREATLQVPGISVLRAASPKEAAQQLQSAFPRARKLHEAAKTVGSTTLELIRSVGFDVRPFPSQALPNHCRIVHPDGAAGFSDENLARLAAVFEISAGDE